VPLPPSRKRERGDAPYEKQENVEHFVFGFVVRLISTLMALCARETSLGTGDDSSSSIELVDLGQSVSAILRRGLPALRISVRWIKSHLDYLHPVHSSLLPTAVASTHSAHLDTAIASEFWASFDTLFRALARSFPLDRLPKPDTDGELILEEDVDVKGLAPLNLSLRGFSAQSRERAELHPNDEQLLRIADLIRSADLISRSEVRERHPFLVWHPQLKHSFFVS
jgi:Est1 DNA/RNA binding domain